MPALLRTAALLLAAAASGASAAADLSEGGASLTAAAAPAAAPLLPPPPAVDDDDDEAFTEKRDPKPQLWRVANLGAAVHSGADPVFIAENDPKAWAAEAGARPSFLWVHGMAFKGTPDDAFTDLVAHWEAATGAFKPDGSGGCTDAECRAYLLVSRFFFLACIFFGFFALFLRLFFARTPF
jgi:hypothetical protein